jgi:cytidylate kinase
LVALAGAAHGLMASDEQGHAALAMRLDAHFESDDAGAERVLLDGREVTRELRAEATGGMASVVAAMPSVRTALLQRQRDYARPPGLVADGRDMGTVVFPAARLKVFLTASTEERALRRYKQLKEKGLPASLAGLSQEILARDRRDSARSAAPLRAAGDAVIIDSTGVPVEAVVERVLTLARERFPAIR